MSSVAKDSPIIFLEFKILKIKIHGLDIVQRPCAHYFLFYIPIFQFMYKFNLHSPAIRLQFDTINCICYEFLSNKNVLF